MQGSARHKSAVFNRGILINDANRPADDTGVAQQDRDGMFGGNLRSASTPTACGTGKDFCDFVHKTVHSKFMKQRDNWSEKHEGSTYVIEPVSVGHGPTHKKAQERLDLLGVNGPTSGAFDFSWMRKNAPSVEYLV